MTGMGALAGWGLVAVLNAVLPATAQRGGDFTAATRMFEARLGEYVAVHRDVERLLPLLTPCEDPAVFIAHRNALAAGIVAARPNARQGDIFAPPVARLFRTLIADAFRGRDVDKILKALFDEHPMTYMYSPQVFASYPDWATQEMTPLLLQRLPPLPHGLEYRLVNRDLLILDTDANLVVDVLPEAITRSDT
jgi:hypothetical protein